MNYGNNNLVDQFEILFRKYYSDEISDLARNYPRDRKSLHVDWEEIYNFDSELAEDYRYHPDRCQEAAEEALRRYDPPIDVSLRQAHVRVYGLTDTNAVSDIHSEHLNRLVAITGVVDRAEAPRSHIEQAVFVCQRCGYQTQIPQDRVNELQEPYQCESCERQGPFKLDPDKSEFVDHQQVRLRERPTGGAATADHESIIAVLGDDLVEEVTPGDHIILSGIVRYDNDKSFDATLS